MANGLGNLIQRVSKICSQSNYQFPLEKERKFSSKIIELVKDFKIDGCLKEINKRISSENKYIDGKRPWSKKGEELEKILYHSVKIIRQIAYDLHPFLPHTAKEITNRFGSEKVIFSKPLFPRK